MSIPYNAKILYDDGRYTYTGLIADLQTGTVFAIRALLSDAPPQVVAIRDREDSPLAISDASPSSASLADGLTIAAQITTDNVNVYEI